MKKEMKDEICELYWEERASTKQIPIQSKSVTNPNFEYEIEISYGKDDYRKGDQSIAEPLVQIAVGKEMNQMFIELMKEIEVEQWGTLKINDDRKNENKHDLYEKTDATRKSRKGTEGEDLLVAHSDCTAKNLNKALEFYGVSEAFISPEHYINIESYDLPLVAFEGFQYEINLDRFQENSTHLSFYLNYELSWDTKYKVDEITVPEIERSS